MRRIADFTVNTAVNTGVNTTVNTAVNTGDMTAARQLDDLSETDEVVESGRLKGEVLRLKDQVLLLAASQAKLLGFSLVS
jgi:hypothetical protein